MVVEHLREHGIDYAVVETNFGARRVAVGPVTVGWVVPAGAGFATRYGTDFERAIEIGRTDDLQAAVRMLDG